MTVTELLWKVLSEYPVGVICTLIGIFVLLLILVLRLDMKVNTDLKKPKAETPEAEEDETP